LVVFLPKILPAHTIKCKIDAKVGVEKYVGKILQGHYGFSLLAVFVRLKSWIQNKQTLPVFHRVVSPKYTLATGRYSWAGSGTRTLWTQLAAFL
jgi:hypothetical protein